MLPAQLRRQVREAHDQHAHQGDKRSMHQTVDKRLPGKLVHQLERPQREWWGDRS